MKTKSERIYSILIKIFGVSGNVFVSEWKLNEATRLISQMKHKPRKKIKRDN